MWRKSGHFCFSFYLIYTQRYRPFANMAADHWCLSLTHFTWLSHLSNNCYTFLIDFIPSCHNVTLSDNCYTFLVTPPSGILMPYLRFLQINLPFTSPYCPLYTSECPMHSCTYIHAIMLLDSAQLCIFPNQTCLFSSCQLAVSLQNISNLRVM